MWDEPLDSKDAMPLWEYWDVSVNNYWDVINSTVSIFCLISVYISLLSGSKHCVSPYLLVNECPTLSKSCSKAVKKTSRSTSSRRVYVMCEVVDWQFSQF